ncbi:MAG TPA: DNA methyltransferase [Phycisphaerae bacterium]|nr:DNA methyltransferase [Phycisphaerae bacterium]
MKSRFEVRRMECWREWVVPKALRSRPIHRWYVFPHSFTSRLVHGLIDEWHLGQADTIIDPFAGAGTTLLAAKEKGVPACGYDISPVAVLAARVKIANYSKERLRCAWQVLQDAIDSGSWGRPARAYPELVNRALPGKLLGAFDSIARQIAELSSSRAEKDFFRLALIGIVPKYSRAVASGGWLKWIRQRSNTRSVASTLRRRVEEMLADLDSVRLPRRAEWRVKMADARQLPDRASSFSAVITSPPYPNRHDYTRVFGVELMLQFLDWEATRQLRYQSFHSHPEARPQRPCHADYQPPERLLRITACLKKKGLERKIVGMLEGYFLDMHLCLREIERVCRPEARIALVLGNAQYRGVTIPVDELTAEIAENAGLGCDRLLAVRYRGNSAQQMGKFGRRPSRETIVLLNKPSAASS